MVTDGDRDGAVVGRDANVDPSALAVLDRVDDQVAQHLLDPARVDVGDTASTASRRAPASPCAPQGVQRRR